MTKMTFNPAHAMALCGLLIIIFAAFALQLHREHTNGFTGYARGLKSYKDWQNYLLYLWCWIVVVGIGIVVTGAIALNGFTK